MIKRRPALVIKDLLSHDVIMCQITTKANKGFEKYEFSLKKEQCVGGIEFDSLIRYDLLFTLHKKLIVRKIGHIKDPLVVAEVFNKLKVLLFD